jgi:hypothetical protein
MDLRLRVLRDADAGMRSKEVAAKYSVSDAADEVVAPRRDPCRQTRGHQH